MVSVRVPQVMAFVAAVGMASVAVPSCGGGGPSTPRGVRTGAPAPKTLPAAEETTRRASIVIRKQPGVVARLGSPLFQERGEIDNVDWSPDGTLIATVGWNDRIHLWDASSGRLWRLLDPQTPFSALNHVAFSPDGKHIGAVGHKGVHIFNVATGRMLKAPETKYPSHPLAWLSNTELRVQRSEDRIVWDIAKESITRSEQGTWVSATEQRLHHLRLHHNPWNAAFSRDGTRLAVSTSGGKIRVFDVPARKLLTEWHVERRPDVALSPKGDRVVTVAGSALRLWRLPSKAGRTTAVEIPLGVRHRDRVDAMRASPDERSLLSVGQDGQVILWNVGSRRGRALVEQPLRRFDVGFARDGRVVVNSVDPEGGPSTLSWFTPKGARTSQRALPFRVRQVRHLPTSTLFTTGIQNLEMGTFPVGNDASARAGKRARLPSHSGVSPGGRWLLRTRVGSKYPVVAIYIGPKPKPAQLELWRAWPVGNRAHRVLAMPALPDECVFSPDDSHVACQSDDGTGWIAVFETASGKRLSLMTGTQSRVIRTDDLAVSAKHNLAVSVSQGHLRVFDTRTGKLVASAGDYGGCQPDCKVKMTSGYSHWAAPAIVTAADGSPLIALSAYDGHIYLIDPRSPAMKAGAEWW